jgi:hypothetical protein
MQHFEAERRLKEYALESKKAQQIRIREELDEKKEIMNNRILERDLLASRMGWDCIDYSSSIPPLLELPPEMYWFRQKAKNKDEEVREEKKIQKKKKTKIKQIYKYTKSFFFRSMLTH